MKTRRNIMMSDDLWRAAQLAAIRESVKRGESVSVSEWVRDAMETKLAKKKEVE